MGYCSQTASPVGTVWLIRDQFANSCHQRLWKFDARQFQIRKCARTIGEVATGQQLLLIFRSQSYKKLKHEHLVSLIPHFFDNDWAFRQFLRFLGFRSGRPQVLCIPWARPRRPRHLCDVRLSKISTGSRSDLTICYNNSVQFVSESLVTLI